MVAVLGGHERPGGVGVAERDVHAAGRVAAGRREEREEADERDCDSESGAQDRTGSGHPVHGTSDTARGAPGVKGSWLTGRVGLAIKTDARTERAGGTMDFKSLLKKGLSTYKDQQHKSHKHSHGHHGEHEHGEEGHEEEGGAYEEGESGGGGDDSGGGDGGGGEN